MLSSGDRAKLVDETDKFLADSTGLTPTFSIELGMAISPVKKNIAGAIVIFKTRHDSLDLQPNKQISAEEISAVQKQVSEETQVMYRDPELWSPQVNGKTLEWALDRMRSLFDEVGTDATFAIVCAPLRIHERISRRRILQHREEPKVLFKTAFSILELLQREYQYDPWNSKIRRGRLGPREGR